MDNKLLSLITLYTTSNSEWGFLIVIGIRTNGWQLIIPYCYMTLQSDPFSRIIILHYCDFTLSCLHKLLYSQFPTAVLSHISGKLLPIFVAVGKMKRRENICTVLHIRQRIGIIIDDDDDDNLSCKCGYLYFNTIHREFSYVFSPIYVHTDYILQIRKRNCKTYSQ
jgi:hypothetical protein